MNFASDGHLIKAFIETIQSWQLSDEAAGGLVGVPAQTVHGWRSGELVDANEELETRLLMVAHLRTALDIYLTEKLANQWMSLKNTGSLCQGASPVEYIAQHGWPGLYLVLCEMQAWAVGN
jgi:hypothetical protein